MEERNVRIRLWRRDIKIVEEGQTQEEKVTTIAGTVSKFQRHAASRYLMRSRP